MACSPGQRLMRWVLPVLWLGALPVSAEETQFGRWQQSLRRCAWMLSGAPTRRCHAVQLDQRSAEVMRLTLQADGSGRGEQMQVVLVGSLVEGSEPMACRDGLCALRQPLELQLVSLSEARFDGRGLAQTLPQTWPVQGVCRISASELHCQAADRRNATAAVAPTWRVDGQR